ncbi:MAG: large-conductance mechanosensitive channel protein MscL [Patescibacteria group bacterium]|jgi:large conductance mechanosensitive channel
MVKFFKEFKDFSVKGNAIDLAVGVIIGGAFGKIVSSLVADIITPPLGVIMGGANFADFKITLKQAIIGANGAVMKPAINLNLGIFLQNVLDFLIIAVVIFIMVKAVTRLKKQLKLTNDEATRFSLTKDQNLLTEIRDLLKEQIKK